jgi:hypothetical protein
LRFKDVVGIATFEDTNVKCDARFSNDGFPDVLAESCIECADEFNDFGLAMYEIGAT